MLIKTLTILTAFALTFFSLPTHAAEDEGDKDPLVGITMSKTDVMQGLEMLKKQGKISNEDYVKAQTQLAGMSDSAINGLKDQAIGIIRKDPDKAVDLYKAPKVDANEVQKQLNAAGQ